MRWRNKKDERYGYYGSFQAPGVENMGGVLCRRDTGQWFETHWVELFTQIGYVVVLSVLLYVVVAGVRLVVWGVKRLACRKCRSAKITGSHNR